MNRCALEIMAALISLSACARGEPQKTGPDMNSQSNSVPLQNDVSSTVKPQERDAVRDNLGWIYFRSGGGAGFPVLIYGSRESDGNVIAFQCRERRIVTALVWRRDDDSARDPINLSSGSQKATLRVRLEAPDIDGHVTARADIPLDAAVLRSFHQSGLLSLKGAGAITRLDTVDDVEKAVVGRFFAEC